MNKKIGVVVAMEEEMKDVLHVFGQLVREDNVATFAIKEFSLQNKQIYLIASGIGNIKAAMATQLLIEKYGVGTIVNFGLVGGLSDDLHGFQELLVNKVVPYDFSFNVSNRDAAGILMGEKSAFMEIDCSQFPFLSELNLTKVVCASADKFVNSQELKDELVGRFGAQICEMEAYGIVSACKIYNVPCIMIKAISDMADEHAKKSFVETASGVVDFYKKSLNVILSNL